MLAVMYCVLVEVILALSNLSSSYDGYKLNSLLTYYLQGLIAQLVEQRTGEASDFILGFLSNFLSCFITTRITFTSHFPSYDGYKMNSRSTTRKASVIGGSRVYGLACFLFGP